jgi:hypothetical protein
MKAFIIWDKARIIIHSFIDYLGGRTIPSKRAHFELSPIPYPLKDCK